MASILVICGGDNAERRVSLSGGDAVTTGLADAGHDAWKLDTADPETIVPPNQPLLDGPVGLAPPDETERATLDRSGWLKLFKTISDHRFDAVFPLLHGGWGEGGQIQAVLELIGIPFLGSDMRSSALALDKIRSHHIAESIGLRVAKAELLHVVPGNVFSFNDAYRAIVTSTIDPEWASFVKESPHQVVLKPNFGGSTVGITISKDEQELHDGLQTIINMGDKPLLEEYVPGREVTVPILGNQALPMLEIVPREGYYDYQNKYTKGMTDYLCPAPVDEMINTQASSYAEAIFAELGCRHVARVDFRLTDSNQLVFLEINTMPGMTDLSLVPMGAKEGGLDFPALMNHFVELVLE
ncbi:MAG TPA: D-alanine--D-alanine ligase [Bacteroidetes bacterium]|nr:D-alanine--D-alanine ligase [Bacteroidota bacterium]HEX05083.1 D-alanine--D-alanine ligase [Bacteroidota bacterium]